MSSVYTEHFPCHICLFLLSTAANDWDFAGYNSDGYSAVDKPNLINIEQGYPE